MSRPAAAPPERKAVSLKTVALPVEHGGWGMLAEPLLLGLVVAPTLAGAGLAVSAVAAFLLRHPLKLALSDWRRGARYPRTAMAERVAATDAALALLGLAVALALAPRITWLPVLLAAPLGLVQLWYDARLLGRQLLPEVLGGTALGASAAAMLLAAGWAWPAAFGAWALLAAKSVASVLYLRARLRLDRDQPASRVPGLAAHAASVALAGILFAQGAGPRLAVAAFLLLLGRAAHGLSPWHARVRPQVVGWTEVAFGLLTVALLAAGYRLRL